jgi:hypothetical protein
MEKATGVPEPTRRVNLKEKSLVTAVASASRRQISVLEVRKIVLCYCKKGTLARLLHASFFEQGSLS